jgi:ribose transport system substrate-binding protein
VSLVSLGVGVLLAASACSSGGDDPSASGGAESVTVGYSGYTVDIGYFVGLEKGMQQGAEAAGVKLISTNANANSSQQLTDIQNLITQGVDYLVISPYDGAAVIPGVKAAQEAGIPVISVADDIKTDIAMTMNLDHVDAGRQQAANLLEFLTAKYGSPKGNVVDMQGTPATVSTGLRGQGLQELVEKYPDITIVQSVNGEWTTEGSNKAMTDVLQAQPDIDAVYTDSGDMAVGALRAIEVAGLQKPVGDPDHIWVGGINGDPNAIAYIRENMQDVEVASNPVKMGALLMDMLKDAKLNGTELPKTYEFKNLAITPENIDSPEVAEYGIWADEVK